MRYFQISYPEDGQDVIEVFSENEIINFYSPSWYARMCKKYGKEYVDANYTKEDCLMDWIIINWAVEVTENPYGNDCR